MKNNIINFLKSTKFKTFYRTTLNGLISLIVIELSGMDYVYIPLIVSSLNLITKELNKNFNPNFGK